MSSLEININPPIQPDISGVAERGLQILPAALAAALLVGVAYFGLKKATSTPDRRS